MIDVKLLVERILLESRLSTAKTKWVDSGKMSQQEFDVVVNTDPTNNQKYINWLLKQYGRSGNTIDRDLLEFFDKNPQLFLEKDINSYKNLIHFETIVRPKYEQYIQKIESKKVDKIYEDDDWMVVSPKSHVASCKYGAGTKWCVTTKDRDTHWNTYSKNAIFYFVINKNLTKEDQLYKVAIRRIGRKGRYEFWDATDSEFFNTTRGNDWYGNLPDQLKEKLREYQERLIDILYQRGGDIEVVEDERMQALINHLAIHPDDFDSIEESTNVFYGMPTYTYDGEEYAVGSENEMDVALREYWEDIINHDISSFYSPEALQSYLYISDTDRHLFASEEADYTVDNLDDDEILDSADKTDEYDGLQEEIDELENSVNTKEQDIIDIMNSDEDGETLIEEIEGEIEDLNNQIKNIEKQKEDLIDESKEIVRSESYDEWYECLSDPYDCLVSERGWYSNLEDLTNNSMIQIDTEELLSDEIRNSDYGTLGFYDGDYNSATDYDGNIWYIIRTE